MGRRPKNGNSSNNNTTSTKKSRKNTISVVEETSSTTACCICGGFEDEELIILCDGKDCPKETHMYCIQPPLFTVPQGEWFCDTCDPKGSTQFLEKYLQQLTDTAALFPHPPTTADYRVFLVTLRQNLLTTNYSINLDIDEELLANEFDVVNTSNGLTAVPPSSSSSSSSSTAGRNHTTEPTPSWIGCRIKIYCPVDQRDHFGRIIDWGFDETKQRNKYLVQFKSGIDGRNAPFITWLILGEHACVLYSDVVWYHETSIGWWPAQYCYRSGFYLNKFREKSINPTNQHYLEFFNADLTKVIQKDDENCLLFRNHDPRSFKRTKAFMLAYVCAESEEEEKLSTIRANKLLPKESILHVKGALVDGLKPKSLQLLSEYAQQLIDILGEDEDEDREISFPDILTVRGTIAVLNDTVQYESSFAEGRSKQPTVTKKRNRKEIAVDSEEEIDEINEFIPVDLVYIASELEPAAHVDQKIALCRRRVIKASEAEETLSVKVEEIENGSDKETNEDNGVAKDDNGKTHNSNNSWELRPFNVAEWITEQATKILLEEEARRAAEREARKEERKKLLAIAREERERKKKEAAEKRHLKYLERKQREQEEYEKREKEEEEEEAGEEVGNGNVKDEGAGEMKLRIADLQRFFSSDEDSNPDAPLTRARRSEKLKKKQEKKKASRSKGKNSRNNKSAADDSDKEAKTDTSPSAIVYPTTPLHEVDRSTWMGRIVRHIISKEVGKIVSVDDHRVEIQTTWGDMKGKDVHFEILHPSSHEFLQFECANILLESSSSESENKSDHEEGSKSLDDHPDDNSLLMDKELLGTQSVDFEANSNLMVSVMDVFKGESEPINMKSITVIPPPPINHHLFKQSNRPVRTKFVGTMPAAQPKKINYSTKSLHAEEQMANTIQKTLPTANAPPQHYARSQNVDSSMNSNNATINAAKLTGSPPATSKKPLETRLNHQDQLPRKGVEAIERKIGPPIASKNPDIPRNRVSGESEKVVAIQNPTHPPREGGMNSIRTEIVPHQQPRRTDDSAKNYLPKKSNSYSTPSDQQDANIVANHEDTFKKHGSSSSLLPDRRGPSSSNAQADRYGSSSNLSDRRGSSSIHPTDRYGSSSNPPDRYGSSSSHPADYGSLSNAPDRQGASSSHPAGRYGSSSNAPERHISSSIPLNRSNVDNSVNKGSHRDVPPTLSVPSRSSNVYPEQRKSEKFDQLIDLNTKTLYPSNHDRSNYESSWQRDSVYQNHQKDRHRNLKNSDNSRRPSENPDKYGKNNFSREIESVKTVKQAPIVVDDPIVPRFSSDEEENTKTMKSVKTAKTEGRLPSQNLNMQPPVSKNLASTKLKSKDSIAMKVAPKAPTNCSVVEVIDLTKNAGGKIAPRDPRYRKADDPVGSVDAVSIRDEDDDIKELLNQFKKPSVKSKESTPVIISTSRPAPTSKKESIPQVTTNSTNERLIPAKKTRFGPKLMAPSDSNSLSYATEYSSNSVAVANSNYPPLDNYVYLADFPEPVQHSYSISDAPHDYGRQNQMWVELPGSASSDFPPSQQGWNAEYYQPDVIPSSRPSRRSRFQKPKVYDTYERREDGSALQSDYTDGHSSFVPLPENDYLHSVNAYPPPPDYRDSASYSYQSYEAPPPDAYQEQIIQQVNTDTNLNWRPKKHPNRSSAMRSTHFAAASVEQGYPPSTTTYGNDESFSTGDPYYPPTYDTNRQYYNEAPLPLPDATLYSDDIPHNTNAQLHNYHNTSLSTENANYGPSIPPEMTVGGSSQYIDATDILVDRYVPKESSSAGYYDSTQDTSYRKSRFSKSTEIDLSGEKRKFPDTGNGSFASKKLKNIPAQSNSSLIDKINPSVTPMAPEFVQETVRHPIPPTAPYVAPLLDAPLMLPGDYFSGGVPAPMPPPPPPPPLPPAVSYSTLDPIVPLDSSFDSFLYMPPHPLPPPPLPPPKQQQPRFKNKKWEKPKTMVSHTEKSIHDINHEMNELGRQLQAVEEELSKKRPPEDFEEGEVSE